MRTFTERLAAGSKNAFTNLRNETTGYKERLLRAEAEASLDPLTSLVQPRGTVFSILLFDINSLTY